jgi:hypothetical protein
MRCIFFINAKDEHAVPGHVQRAFIQTSGFDKSGDFAHHVERRGETQASYISIVLYRIWVNYPDPVCYRPNPSKVLCGMDAAWMRQAGAYEHELSVRSSMYLRLMLHHSSCWILHWPPNVHAPALQKLSFFHASTRLHAPALAPGTPRSPARRLELSPSAASFDARHYCPDLSVHSS